MTFLAIDVGNTRLKWALYAAPKPGAAMLTQGAVFLEAIDGLAEGPWLDLGKCRRACSAASSREKASAAARRRSSSSGTSSRAGSWSTAQACGVTNGYDHPTRLGVDRWVALIGARHRILERGAARPALVVMVGTAVTVDALDADGPLPRRPDPARLRPDAARARDGHGRPQGADRRGRRFPDQHQRRA